MNGDALSTGSVAPNFTLLDQDGEQHALSDYRGDWVLLCFYPKDDIVGCAREICSLRDHFETFQKLGITILGISADSVQNHKQFADRNHIPFPLLSDTHKKVADQYDILPREQLSGNDEGIMQASFLINLAGDIEKIYSHIKPGRHASEVLVDIAAMQKEDAEPGSL